MRKRLAVAGGALAVGMLAAGCSSTGHSGAASASTTSPTGTPGASSGGGAVADAFTRTTDAKTAKVMLSATTTVAQGGRTVTAPLSGSGSIDFTNHDTDLSFALPAGLGNAEMRLVNGVTYYRLPPAVGSKLSGGKPWISVNLSKLGQQKAGGVVSQLQQESPSDPARTLEYLRGIGTGFRDLGSGSVEGTPTTHYAATVDLDRIAAADPSAAAAIQRLEKELGSRSVPLGLWIDGQGRLRRMTATEHLRSRSATTGSSLSSTPVTTGPVTVSETVTLSEFGTPVSVVAPPASQTTDVTGRA